MNADIDSLNEEYALQNHLFFKQLPSGFIVAQIDTPFGYSNKQCEQPKLSKPYSFDNLLCEYQTTIQIY